jgi:pimeloyl-ACP methyl ester carboxylesterase
MSSNDAKPTSRTHVVQLQPDLPLTLTEAGSGRPVLVLHGGGGPFTVAGLAAHLAQTMHAITPTLPGWNGTARPPWLSGVDDLAIACLDLLEDRELRDVLVVGSSLGGWIASEMALRDRDRRIRGLVLIDAGGVLVEGEPCRDFFALSPREVAEYSFADPARFFVDPATIPPEQLAVRRANVETMRVLAGPANAQDPKLLRRLARVRVPTLVLWGDSDRIYTPAYGRAYAAAFGDARFELIERAGHLPQLEQPARTFELLDRFAKPAAS